ncbi:MAG: GGDEF domain-containing protein [Xanthomonadales bacterium]|jgi:EAL domain-containing protein (putative c-di-GMP-specific phosphodiesterase class I)|nr:GGDEF domain-containing protein [Xanthomonadales bacterium]
MPPDSPILLVVDPNPECAARVNSLLRNSGISVHILHADNPTEAERLVREFRPFLIYYLPDARIQFPIGQAARLADSEQVFLGVSLEEHGQALFQEAAGAAATLGIGNEAQLPAIVNRLAGLGRAAQLNDAQRAQEAELEQRLDLLLNSTSEPIAYVHEGLHVAANQAYLELLGAESLDALTMVSLLEILEREGTDLKAMIRGFGRQEFPDAGSAFLLRPPGREPVEVQLTFAPVRFEGEDCVQMLVREASAVATENAPAADATSSEPAAEPAAEQAEAPKTVAPPPEPSPAQAGSLDPLTGMLWRADFMQRLNHRLSHPPEDLRAGVLFVGNDNAASQLETLSVEDMDRYVQASANEILSCLEEADDVCRFQDSVFVIYAERQDKAELKRLGEKIRTGIEQLGQQRPEDPVPTSCSIGLALLDQNHQDGEHTLEKARAAYRLAAEQGNTVLRYRPSRAAGVSDDEEAQWKERIRYAIDNEDFFTVQHSIMNLDGDLEGLVENRTFLHEGDSDLPAADYLAAAERNQLASQIDRLVIPSLLRAVNGSEDRQIIDISGNSLQDFSFPTWFQRTLQDTRTPGKRVVLQWPAWAAREQVKAARRLIEELAPLGVQFSVSEFDTDPKTLELLQHLKLQFVTLDRALTSDLQSDPQRLDAIREIIRAAEEMQMLTIASDVPTSGDLAMLWRGGVKLVSGEFIQETPRVIGQ